MNETVQSVIDYVFAWHTIWIILALVLLWQARTMVYTVKGKTAAILETFGKPHDRAAMPGLRFKLPNFITRVVARVNLQQQEIGDNISVKTKDNAFLSLPVKVQYSASSEPEGAVKAHYELENPEEQIKSYILNNVRQTSSGMEMDELYNNRDSLEQQVKTALTTQFAMYGYVIKNVLVDQPQPSSEVAAAFNRVIASKRLKEAAENEAEAAKIKLVGVAKAESESKKLQGEGMANMRKAIAEGLETSMETIKKAGLNAQEAMAFLTETNRLDTIATAAAHGNMVIVDTRNSDHMIETAAAVKGVIAQRPHAVETPKAA
jgi:regulator of protease activity HflC (stomatin/prohibitin superfamily)